MDLEQIAREFPGASGYLNTASIGLPPHSAVAVMHAAIDEWQRGDARAPQYDAAVAEARERFARIVGTPARSVVVGAQVSALVALAATVLGPGATVLCPDGDFTSVLFPFAVRDDLEVRTVPLADLASSISPDIDLVAFSVVQSADGARADTEAIRYAARAAGALTLADATQSAGWLPLATSDFDFVVAGAYKWLLSPRGTAFMTLGQDVIERVQPLYAGWYAGDDPWQTIYGLPLRLAADARRFDLSPAWLSWVGTAPALRLIEEIGVDAIGAHDVGLANTLCAALELPPANSAIVSIAVDPGFDERRLDGLATAHRAGRLRVGFHLYNTEEDVARTVEALRG